MLTFEIQHATICFSLCGLVIAMFQHLFGCSLRIAAFLLASSIGAGLGAHSVQAAGIAIQERIRSATSIPLSEPKGTLRFTVANAIRATPYLVQVWVPPGQAPSTGWPVLYVMDGKVVFDVLARQSALNELASVVVGISYASPGVQDARARAYDYTPPSVGAAAPIGLPHNPAGSNPFPGGGAEIFLTLLLNYIEPLVARRVSIDPAQRMLYGHSYGGLFVLYAYLRQPRAFAYSFAASPSLWWNRQALMANVAALHWPPEAAGVLSIMIGEVEAGGNPKDSLAAAFHRAIAQHVGPLATFESLPGKDHGPMVRTLTVLLKRFPVSDKTARSVVAKDWRP